MILPAYLQCEVEKFCKIMGINISGGRVLDKHTRLLQDFITDRLKKDRAINRELESKNRFKAETILKNVMLKFKIESPIEQILLDAFVVAGLSRQLKTQYKIGNKRVDFAFPDARLVVEADGKDYHFIDQQQIERDQERDKYLARKKWRIIHIEGLAIRRNVNLCVEKVKEQLKIYA